MELGKLYLSSDNRNHYNFRVSEFYFLWYVHLFPYFFEFELTMIFNKK